MMSLQEDNHASHSVIFSEDCKDYYHDIPTSPTFEKSLFDVFPLNEDLFDIYHTQDKLMSNEVLFLDEYVGEASLDLHSTIPDISHDHFEENERGDLRGDIDSYVESPSEDPHKDNQDFTWNNSFTNPLFQFKELEEFNAYLSCMHALF